MVTETWDLEGSIVETKPVGVVTQSQLEEAAFSLKGEIIQMPPVFSAKKISGKPAYYYARNDTEHEKLKKLKASNISIYDIKINSFDGLDGNMSICCSSGTYVRSIVNDIGNTLGCGATLTHLTRDSIGKFELKDSIDADDIEKIGMCTGGNTDVTEQIACRAKQNAVGGEENDDGAKQNVCSTGKVISGIEENADGTENSTSCAKLNAGGAEQNADVVKEITDSAKQNADCQNTAKCRDGIFSIEKILQLKYL